jgi:EmrB/QacA subfamily drug resistance transporter
MNTHPDQRRWAILGVLAAAQLMVALDATIVNIALPSAQHALHFSDADRQWIVTGYALAFGSLLLLGGRIGDFFGRKLALVVGLVGFAVASAIGGLAQSFELLLLARVLQGAFAALLAPAALSLLTTTFTDAKERAKAFGIFGAVAGSGAAVGLLLGGALTSYLSWRWCLYVNLLIALPVALAAMSLLRNRPEKNRPKLDLAGTLTATFGLLALVYGFSTAATHGWGSAVTILCIAAGLVLLAAFVLVERRVAHPLLPLRVVTDRMRGGSYLVLGAVGAGMFGVFLFVTYYLEGILGFSPIETGAAFLPMVALLVVTASVASTVLQPRLGEKTLVVAGMLTATAGMAYLTQLHAGSDYLTGILPALLLNAVGLGLVFPAATNGATSGLDHHDAGVGSAMVNTAQQVGGSIGTALLNTIAASATTAYVIGGHRSTEATVHGYTVAFWWSAGIFVVGTLLAMVVLRGRAHEERAELEPVPA